MIDPADVAAVIVTRGDVPLDEIIESLIFGRKVVWNNANSDVDEGAFGRYVAAANMPEVVYFQDDDCVVPEADQLRLCEEYELGTLTALMPPERIDYYDTVLVGWGALCHHRLPWSAFARWRGAGHSITSREFKVVGADFVFPMLSKWKRVDGAHRNLPHAHAPNRTWGSYPNYGVVKEFYLREARKLRDGH